MTAVFAPSAGVRSEHAAVAGGVKLVVFRRQAARGWRWIGQHGSIRTGGSYGEGRAPTRAAAQTAALNWAAGLSVPHQVATA